MDILPLQRVALHKQTGCRLREFLEKKLNAGDLLEAIASGRACGIHVAQGPLNKRWFAAIRQSTLLPAIGSDCP